MCGIAGKVKFDGSPVEPSLIDAMCSVIVHRGPDSRGTYVTAGVGLGIQRLAVIDLDTGNQPIFNEDRSVVVVLNGEIYNYRELRGDLEARGHRFSTRTDTEVIVHLYEEHGERCVDHLRGMFAFAIWDAPNRRLLLARDRVGKKPLFYAVRGRTLWFASEPKAILQDPTVPREPDLAALDAYLTLGSVPHPLSAFAGISKLPPAHTLVFEGGGATPKRYWKLSYAAKLASRPSAEIHELLREELLDATRLRLRSDVPVGAFLSGGVDSSAVTAAMARVSSSQIRTFSIGFESAEFDETSHAREVASLLGTEHHEFFLEPHAAELLPLLAWHYGEPFADQSAIPTFYLSQVTREHVTVALTGDGGDENFAGYPRYFGNRLADRLRWVPPAGARAFAAALEAAGTGSRMNSTRARLVRLARALATPAADRYGSWMAITQERDRRLLYTNRMRAASDPAAIRRVTSAPYEESDATDAVERLLDVDVETHLVDQLLVKVDIASMAHSLEVRSPLLDHRFMELAASLPPELKLRGRTSKSVFKDAIRPWLPDHVLDRPKRGFGVPIRDWLRHELRELAENVLLDPVTLRRDLLREAELRRLIDDHVASRADNSSVIWALIQLELWFRTYIDRVPSGPISVS